MKLPARLAIVGFVAALLLSVVIFKPTYAQSSLTADQLQLIKDNCVSIKSTLNQLHVSDALLRVNRGQIYEAVGTKLMDKFNGRLTSNGQDATGTLLVAANYRTTLTSFQNDYIVYERQLSDTLKIDCTSQPAEFSDAIDSARTKRAQLHSDVNALRQYIDDYRSAVNDFLINFQRVKGSQ